MQIQVANLSKHFGQGEARSCVLADVDLEIGAGEFVSIVGTSGSGKTTLLNVMGDLDREYDGQVFADQEQLGQLSDKTLSRLRNRHFGFIFQQFNLLDHLTAAENIALPSYFSDQAGAADPGEHARHLLDKVGMADKVDERPPQLSGGQKQRVAIARALYHQPSIIFCDEPTGSLDRKTGLQIMKLFQDLNGDDEMTLIVVTHEEHIARMASRIVRLEDGHVIADEPNEPVAPDELGLLRMGQDDDIGPEEASALPEEAS